MKEFTLYIKEEDYDRVIAALSSLMLGDRHLEPSEELAAAAIMRFISRTSKSYDQAEHEKVFEHNPPAALVPVEWVQPVTEGYRKGVVVKHNDEIWISSVDNNVWEPGVSGWHQWGEDPDEGPFPWVEPTGSHDAYQTGDRVIHNDQTWESEVDNNVWEPGVHGWVVV